MSTLVVRNMVCDVKVPLYVQARFKDVEQQWKLIPGHRTKFHQGWVATNTRFTSDALQYDDMVGHNIMRDMQIAREVCTEGNALRKKLGIPVRQPLSRFIVKNWDLSSEYATLVKEELNVKDIVAGDETVLDINITPELKLEGDYRELVRKVQDLRKEKGLIPSDAITLVLPETYREIMQTFGEDLKKTVGAKEVVNGENMLIY